MEGPRLFVIHTIEMFDLVNNILFAYMFMTIYYVDDIMLSACAHARLCGMIFPVLCLSLVR